MTIVSCFPVNCQSWSLLFSQNGQQLQPQMHLHTPHVHVPSLQVYLYRHAYRNTLNICCTGSLATHVFGQEYANAMLACATPAKQAATPVVCHHGHNAIVAGAGLAAEVTELRGLVKRLEEKLQAKPQEADQLKADLQAARQHIQELCAHQPQLHSPPPVAEATGESHSPPISPQHATADSPGSVLNSCLSLTLPSSSDTKAHAEEVDELEGCPPAPLGS